MTNRNHKDKQSPTLLILYGTHWRWIAAWYAVKNSLRKFKRKVAGDV
jgi:hypothetical protein